MRLVVLFSKRSLKPVLLRSQPIAAPRNRNIVSSHGVPYSCGEAQHLAPANCSRSTKSRAKRKICSGWFMLPQTWMTTKGLWRYDSAAQAVSSQNVSPSTQKREGRSTVSPRPTFLRPTFKSVVHPTCGRMLTSVFCPSGSNSRLLIFSRDGSPKLHLDPVRSRG